MLPNRLLCIAVIIFCSWSLEVAAEIKGTKLDSLPSGHLIVDVTIKNSQAKFIVDTGASSSVIDKSLVKALKLEPLVIDANVQGFAAGDQMLEMQQYQVDAINIGKLVDTGVVFVEQDLTPMFEGLADYPIQGIIGQEILAQFGLLLDIAQAKLYLPDQQLIKNYIATPIKSTDIGLFFMAVDINQNKLNMLIDSGATEIMIDKAVAEKKSLGKVSYENQMEAIGDNGEVRKIGLIENSQVIIASKNFQTSLLVNDFSGLLSQINLPPSNPEISGLVGLSTLAKLSAIIDVKNQRLYVR